MRIAIYVGDGEREDEIGECLVDGFNEHGESVVWCPIDDYVQPNGDTQAAVMIGLSERNKQIFEDHRRAARHTLLVCNGYFGSEDYLRVVLDGVQPRYAGDVKRPTDRLDVHGIKFLPKRERGKHVIYAGSSQAYCDWHGLGDAFEFDKGICHAVNKQMHSEMPVYYLPRVKTTELPMNTLPVRGPLSNLLRESHVLVTHGARVALDAIAAGIPAIVVSDDGVNPAWPIAEKSIESGFHGPFFPSDKQRLQRFADLAYCQFTLEEIASGLAWETLIPHTAKGIAAGLPESEFFIELYRKMHQSPKMFRGASTKGHVEAVCDLVGRYRLNSMLDYGSGKGEQYDRLRLHEKWGGVRPACYDPGYPPLAEKPKGKFDGVICLDVAEHIPESGLDDFIRDVVGYADKVAFFCIFTEPSRKFLPNGDNCHKTVEPPEWWLDRLAKVTGASAADEYDIRKPLPGGGFEEFRHTVLRKEGGPDVVATFRGSD